MATTGGYTLDELLAEEARLILPSLSNDDALGLGLLMMRRARERELPVVVEIRRAAQVLFRVALAGSSPDNDGWVAAKVRVVERFGHSTLYERVRHEIKGTSFEAATGLPLPEFAAHGGGFPLIVAGTGVVGAVVVSGLPQVDDHRFVVECLEGSLAGRSQPGPSSPSGGFVFR